MRSSNSVRESCSTYGSTKAWHWDWSSMTMLAGKGMVKETDTLFKPQVVGRLIDGVEVWRKVGARRADGHVVAVFKLLTTTTTTSTISLFSADRQPLALKGQDDGRSVASFPPLWLRCSPDCTTPLSRHSFICGLLSKLCSLCAPLRHFRFARPQS